MFTNKGTDKYIVGYHTAVKMNEIVTLNNIDGFLVTYVQNKESQEKDYMQ